MSNIKSKFTTLCLIAGFIADAIAIIVAIKIADTLSAVLLISLFIMLGFLILCIFCIYGEKEFYWFYCISF